MRKVVTISLNGNAYQSEEGGYDALQAYLESAQAKLREDPGRAEIMADLEQAIAEKCNRFLGAHKSVVTAEEMQQVLTEMGPVDGQPASGGAEGAPGSQKGSDGPASDSTTARRLYQIREGAVISGVCKGIAAYFNVDVAIVRLIFIALAILTWGAWILAYIVMMFVIPYASTSEEHAAAHGQPFDAQHLIEEAKKHFRDGASTWRRAARANARAARQEARQWRREWRRERRKMRDHMRWGAPPIVPEDASYATRVLMGVLIPIAALCNAVLIIAFLVILAQLFTRGSVFGWEPPPEIPLWADALILFVLLHICAAPLRAVRHAGYYAYGTAANVWFAVWGSILWVGFVIVFFWLAYLYWPDVAQFLRDIADSIRNHGHHAPGDHVLFGLWQFN
jgi:phage shock protein PspC (stress-responsive transcriptional regulator)